MGGAAPGALEQAEKLVEQAATSAPRDRSRAVVLGLLLVFAGGIGTSMQAFYNGRLAGHLGSPLLAAAVNSTIGLTVLLIVVVARRHRRQAVRKLWTARARLRWWHFAAGANSALFAIVASEAAPRVGVALLSVALVAGQTVGALIIDRIGMSPAGRRPFTRFRLIGSAVTMAAVAVGAAGSQGDLRVGLLALAVLTGSLVGVQQAGMGHLVRATGEPLVGSLMNIAVGAVLSVGVALAVTHGTPPGEWSAPPVDWIGGLIGAIVATVLAATVGRVGVLRLMLTLVAGQVVGALTLDIIAPVHGEGVTALTFAGVALAMAGVYISGIVPGARRGRPLSTR